MTKQPDDHAPLKYEYLNTEVDPELNFTDVHGPDGMVSCATILERFNSTSPVVSFADVSAAAYRALSHYTMFDEGRDALCEEIVAEIAALYPEETQP